MLKIKKEHVKDAREIYFKNKKTFMKKIPFFKNISEEKRIQVFAESLVYCDQKIKEFEKKYPNGFPWDSKEFNENRGAFGRN